MRLASKLFLIFCSFLFLSAATTFVSVRKVRAPAAVPPAEIESWPWKRYSNETLGFSFEYNARNAVYTSARDALFDSVGDNALYPQSSCVVEVENTNAKTLDVFIEEVNSRDTSSVLLKEGEVVVDGVRGYILTPAGRVGRGVERYLDGREVALLNDGRVYFLRGYCADDRVLATFQFLRQGKP